MSDITDDGPGVVISHIAVANNIAALSRLFGLDMTVRTLQFAHFTFDVFALDVFMTWGAGGCLVAGDHSEILLDLSSFIRRREITYAQLTPSVIHMLDPLQVGPSLRVLASSGEAMTQSIVHAWASRTELYNCYGPTETDVVTAHRVTDQCSPLNIGAPTEGMTVLLLDDCGKQVGTGVEGEICVQGPQVMLRYLNSLESPDDWHCMDLAGRYYRTRDFGRMESTGDITFVGRRDHQVKIRGHRVNLAEIENVLQRDPDVAYAICLFPTAGSFQAHLCAFIQRSAKALLSANHDAAFEPAPMKEASTIISRAHDVLRGVLPAAMLPTQWWCGMLPVTTSGKIDRQRLISWVEQDAAHAQAHRVLPGRPLTLDESSKVDESSKGKGTSTLENTIRVVWGSLLDIPPAQIPSDLTFYAAGGHSILAIRLIATLRSHGISMTLAELRAANTIEEQVRFAHQSVGSAIASNKLNPHRPFDLLESCDASFVETVAKSCSTTPEVVADVYPCTAMQKGLMAASLQNPGRYICHFRFQSQRGFDTAEFKEAWSALVASEPILRTRIVSEQGSGMLQVVLTSESGALSMSPKGFARNNRWLGSPLWSLHANSTSTWDLYIHHVLLDGWQSQLLLHKMNSLLSSHSRIPPLLSDGSRAHGQQGSSFADFICHLQRVPPAEPSHVFWTRMLADATPSDVPPKPAGVDLCSVESLCLSSAITLDYRGIAARCSVPPGIILSTIWTLVYSGLASESHVTYGTILSGRDTPVKGIEDIFGPTFAVVPFVCELDSAASFEDLLHLHDRTYTDIAPHQHFGLQNIRRLNANCLEICSFRVLFVIQPELEEPLEDHAIRLEAETQPSYEYPLVMTFTMQKGNRFQVQAHSWPNAIRPEEVQCVLDQIAEVAQKISKDGIAQSLRQLGTASDAQAKRMLANSSTPTAHDITIPEIFLGSASLSPDAMALYDQASDVSLTYQTVDVLSAALAAELKSRGARHEEIVPICMEKSAAAIVAMLGIHRAGCAYVPVDPTHPLQRRISLLQRVGAKIVICGRDYRDDYSTVVNEMIVVSDRIDSEQTTIVTQAETSDVQSDDSWSSLSPPSSASNLDDSAPNIGSSHTGPTSNGTLPASDSPAFVLYTSGSTGEPKGVVLTHRNIATAIHHLAESFRLRPGIRTLQFSAFTFDMSLMEIYMAWLCGGCVCVPSPHARMNELSKSLRSMRIDTVVATSTVASLLRLEDAPYLETMIISGERLTMAIAEKWSDVVHLYQCYGPTESGISVTSIRVPAGSIDLANIGPPISARVWIVDEECAVLPPGYLGEIAISGPTVARGYFNNDDLTKNRFVNIQVIKDAPPERVYLTGDIGRLDGHGHIRIQGRRDFQVKIHGIRVELGEIEDKVLETDRAAISQVVVTYTAGRLIAFIRLDSAYREVREGSMACRVEPIVERINGHLQSILPNYMIPSRYIFVDEFPKTSSGKIDRRQLELSAHQDDSRHLEQEPERISIPPSLKDLLEKVLDIRDGRTLVASDSFFDLGGDSFSAIRLVAAARDAGYTITVQQIFATPRIDAIWAHMSRDTQGPTRDATSFPSTAFALKDFLNGDDIRAATGLERHQIEDVYPCTPFQEGIAALTIASPDLYVARHVFKAVGCEANRLEKAVRLIIEQTPMLRTAIVTTSTLGTLQVVASSDVALKSCLATSHRPLRSLLAESPQIGHPYLCNVQIVSDEASSQCHISLTMSHAMYDGWSHDLLLADILTAYEKGTFQAPDVSFQHFVAFQYAEQSSPEHRDWWKDYLHDSSAASYPDPPPSDTTGSLIADQLQSGQNCIQWPGSVSKTALLHAAWTLILSLYENVTEPCYATVFAGRDVDFPGIETVRGPTMSAAVCRLPFDPQHRILAYLRQIERTLADMRSHVLIGLQNIRNIDDHTAQACDVRTMLVVQPEARCDPLADNAGIQFELVDDRMSHGYPLTMECEPRRDSVTTRLYFDEAWISAEQAARITGQFVFLVGELCKGVELDLCIEEMTVVPAGDLEKIQEWNHIQLSSVEENVYGLIRRSVHAMHDRPAIECTFSPTISYFELDGLVCNLAGQLRARGLCSREKVLVQMAKSPQQIIAILAVLSVGATFVPVDLEWPPERAQRVAVTSEASWILVDSNSMLQAALLPTNINVVTITAKALQDRSPASEAPASSDIHPEDTAYILFTSGSTGEPKGICTPHSAACTAVLAIVKDCGISPKSRVLAFSSLTFDASILEIFGTLFAGGVICLPSERERLYGLEDTICTLQSNWLGLTPGVASTISPDKVPGVQSLMLFGESIPQTLVEAWYPHVRVIFGYGPTETTIAVTAHHDSRDPYCIGKAIGSTTTWVVDPRNHHRLMPIGAVGELVCIGPTIATGYVNDPERTEVSFLQPPRWANEESQKWRAYRTGDLVRYYPDGSIRILGRADGQVKIRGKRVELSEIDAIVQNTGLTSGVATEVLQTGHAPRLVCFIVVRGDVTMGADRASSDVRLAMDQQNLIRALKLRLEESLPSYMQPWPIFAIDRLPRGSSGKVDRRLLRQLAERWMRDVEDESEKVDQSLSTLDMGSHEQMLRDIWADVLQIDRAQISCRGGYNRIDPWGHTDRLQIISPDLAGTRCRRCESSQGYAQKDTPFIRTNCITTWSYLGWQHCWKYPSLKPTWSSHSHRFHNSRII
jgi:amino acid adenylation domain-containing protein